MDIINEVKLKPQKGFQEQFSRCPADILISGAAAGVGKSFISLMEPIRHLKVKNFGATFFVEHMHK